MHKNQSLELKRQDALKYLGEKWVLHKNYALQDKHKFWSKK